MKTTSLAAALLFPLAVLAQTAPLLSINDPEGDDLGDGSLVYPRDSAFESGDLDLRSLQAFAADGGLRFEATFRNAIRHPSTVKAPGLGSEDLSMFARRGFYAFNLDIYLDTDRIAGSGNTVTLPGRRATIDPAHAWEKAIVLTPRPELMKRQLTDALAEAAPDAGASVAATVDRSVFFATDVSVRGRTVSFFVPGSFIDAKALAGASITALVTEAQLSIKVDTSGLIGKSSGNAVERLTLGAAQPEAGRPELAMGYSNDRAPATAVVDLLSPDPRQQAAQLAAGARITGLNRDNRMGALSVIPAAPAAAPAATTAAQATADTSWFGRALDSVSRVFGGGSTAPAAPAAAAATGPAPTMQQLLAPAGAAPAATPAAAPAAPGPAPTMQSLMAPAAAAAAATPAAVAAPPAAAPAAPVATPPPARVAAPVAPAAAAAVPPTPRAREATAADEIEQRLITLKRLRDKGLISEEEYQQKRREVIDKL